MNERLLTGVLVLTLGACAQQSVALHQQGGSTRLAMNEGPVLDLGAHCDGEVKVQAHSTPADGLLTLVSLGQYHPSPEVQSRER